MSTAITTSEPVGSAAQLPAIKKVRKSFSSPVASLVVIVMTVLWTLPTLGLLVTSLRSKDDVQNTGWWSVVLHPHFTFDNYNSVLFSNSFGVSGGLMPYVVNSLAICIPATIIPITIAAMAAYALAWVRFRGSDTVFFIIFGLQVVPLQLALIPLLSFYTGGAHIGSVTIFPSLSYLKGTYAEVWLSHTMFAMPLAIFLLHNFIAQLPRDLMEAARVDGASHFKIFRTMVVPLSMPAIASFAIFQFIWVWNDLLVALVFGSSPKVQPLTARLSQLTGSQGSHWELLTAAGFISIVIPMIVFFALQRFFVRGLLAGSVKG